MSELTDQGFERAPTGVDWADHLPDDDLITMLDEIEEAVGDTKDDARTALEKLKRVLRGWQPAGEQLADPDRRAVLLGGPFAPGEYTVARRPGECVAE